LAGEWRRLDERFDDLSRDVEASARKDAAGERLMSVPGRITVSAMVAATAVGRTSLLHHSPTAGTTSTTASQTSRGIEFLRGFAEGWLAASQAFTRALQGG
jgi:transposase